MSWPVVGKEPVESPPGRAAAASRLARSRALNPTTVALAAGACIALLALLDLVDGRPHDALLGLDNERSPAAAFSALLLLGVAALALARGVQQPARRLPFGLLFGLLALFMAVDEAFELHERVETWVGADWQLLYLPLFAACGVAWVGLLLTGFARRRERLLWLAGAAAWAIAQLLESLQWDGDALVHAWMIVPEEVLEMAGSTCWLLALLLLSRVRASARD